MLKKETCFGVIPLREHNNEWQVFLVHHKKGDYWGFPKGHWDENESPHQVAKRELKEETGLDLGDWWPLPPMQETYQFQRDGISIEKTVTYFPALVHGHVTIQAVEINEGKWVSLNDAFHLLTFEGLKQQCLEFFPKLRKKE